MTILYFTFHTCLRYISYLAQALFSPLGIVILAVLTTSFFGASPNCTWALVQGNPVYVFNRDEKPVSISAITRIFQSTKPNEAKNA